MNNRLERDMPRPKRRAPDQNPNELPAELNQIPQDTSPWEIREDAPLSETDETILKEQIAVGEATILERGPGIVNTDLKPEERAIAMQRKLRADRRAARAAEPLIE